MRKIARKTLVKKVQDGCAEIEAYSASGNYADVRLYNAKGIAKRETVELTGKWPEGWGGEE